MIGGLLVIGLVIAVKSVSSYVTKFEDIRTHLDSFDDMELTENSITLTKLDGAAEKVQFSTSDTIRLYFWKTSCPDCITELSTIGKKNLQNRYYILLDSSGKAKVQSDELLSLGLTQNVLEKINVVRDTQLPFKPNNLKYFPAEFSVSNDSIWKD